jgi:H+/Cl- antiporter ClcA
VAFLIVVFSASFFTWALPLVTDYRLGHPMLIFAMPLLIGLIWWDRHKPQDVISSRSEVTALRDSPQGPPRPIRIVAGLKQIFKTLLAHLVGASVGREAVGLQLGGWSGRLRNAKGWYFAGCIAAGFAIVLGTPVTAAVFVFESKRWRLDWRHWLGVPTLAFLGYRLSLVLGVTHSEYHPFSTTWTELVSIGWLRLVPFALVLIASSGLLSFLFLKSLERAAKRPPGVLNGLVLPMIFLCTVTFVFNAVGFAQVESMGLPGLGTQALGPMFLIEPDLVRIFSHPLLMAVLKVFLTAAFVGIGVRGGELTPLLFSGAALSVGLGLLFGFPIASMVSIGFPLVWGIAARRPLAAGVLALEIFGFGPFASLGIFVAIAVFCGVKLGDSLAALWNRNRPKDSPSAWSRELYD